MTKVEIENDRLVARIQGLDQVLAFKSELSIPLAHVKGAAESPPDVRRRWRNPLRIRLLGSDMPYVVMAGSFVFLDGEHAFWDVHDPDRTVVIELDHERFAKLVLEVEDPQATAAAVNAAVAGPRGGAT
ncbi:MAG TPA: hypothetical protein VG413_07160 [Candidatus Dormibacteraeota bacterium]|nr:hypothetical protein [Candidatus Dormibacteraeota bacterium]